MSERAMTREQIEANYARIAESVRDLSRSWIMTSGAGCGKTYQMVQRYVAILEQGGAVGEIIAVTYTEKAAAELKDRVRRTCRELMMDEQRPEEERRGWERAARQLANAPVSTIHGLCARLLRENAIAAGVDPRFTVLDAMGQGMLLRETMRETLLERLHAGEESARACVARWGLGGTCELIGMLIDVRETHPALLAEAHTPESLRARWETAFDGYYAQVLDTLTSCELWAQASECVLAVEPCPMEDDAAMRHCAVQAAHAVVMDATRPLSERIAAFKECLARAHKGNVGNKGNWAGRAEDLTAIRGGLRALGELRDACAEAGVAFCELEDAATAELACHLLAEARAGAEAYEAAKREAAALDFADLQITARDMLARNPEVLARMRRRYRHLLVDEFQDTNALQKEIIWLIAGGDPESGRPPARGGLFIVGDAKQSIYGFRNADVTVFNRTARDFSEENAAGPIPLETTRRSRPELVAFFNALFSRPEVMGTEAGADYEAHYQPVSAYRDPHPMDCEVELILVPKDELAGEPAEGEEQESVGVRVARQREAELLAARIREIVESGEPQVCDADTLEPRGARYGDFGMLFQSTSDIGVYEYALRRAGVPFYTVAGRGFYNRQEIRDCLSLLQVLENATNEIALVGVLRSPMFGLSDDTIFLLTREHHRLLTALRRAAEGQHEQVGRLNEEQRERIRRADRTLSRLRAIRDQVALSELIERMLAETGLGAVQLTQFSGRQAAANLAKLTDLARAFEGRGAFSLREFIAYLSDLVLQEPREGLAEVYEEGADVVKLMTVHGAKGLEWPIVIVPDLSRKPNRTSEAVRFGAEHGLVAKMEASDGTSSWGAVGEILHAQKSEREVAERRRLLYVALTRARDMLILSSPLEFAGKDDKRRLSAGYWLTWLTEGLGLDCTALEDGQEVTGDGWRVSLTLGGTAPAEAAARGEAAHRADPSQLAMMGAAEPAPLPERVGRVDPATLTPERLTITALQCYRQCPRLFSLRYLRGLSEAGGVGDWLEGLSAPQFGDIAHRALEMIGRGGREPGVIEDALAQLQRPGGLAAGASPRDIERIERAVRWLVEDATDDAGRAFYDEWIADARRLRAEVPFVTRVEEMLVDGVIDALAEDSGGGWRIIDYKTGSPNERKLSDYAFQVGLYCAAVEQITGRLPVSAAVVLLDQQRILALEPQAESARAMAGAREVIAGVRGAAFHPRSDCERALCKLAYACGLA